MFSKRGRAVDPSLPAAKRLRENTADLFLTNQVSAARAKSLLQDAVASGSAYVADLVHNLGSDKNTARNLRRKLLRVRSGWPKLYWHEVRAWNPKTVEEEVVKLPMYLVIPFPPRTCPRKILTLRTPPPHAGARLAVKKKLIQARSF